MKRIFLLLFVVVVLCPISNLLAQESGGKVYFEVVESDGGEVKVAVLVDAVIDPLFGAAFNIHYDNALLDYKSYLPGDLFGQSAMMLVHQDRNRIVSGVSLKRGDELVNIDKPVRIATYVFKRRAQGKLNFVFTKGNMAKIVDGERVNVENIDWVDFMGNDSGQLQIKPFSGFKISEILKNFSLIFISSLFIVWFFYWGHSWYFRKKTV